MKNNCKDHINLVVEVTEMRKDVKWLIGRELEKQANWEKKQANKAKAKMWRIGILTTAIISLIGIIFGGREDIREWINWWIHRGN